MKTIFSPCRKYRYTLIRDLGEGNGQCSFICLNPSTADETRDDPTVRRCMNFARGWGYRTFCMLNLFAYRSTDPSVMKAQADPVGPENDKWIDEVVSKSDLVVAAWGNHGTFQFREIDVISRHRQKIHYLKMTSQHCPSHPLYLLSTIVPKPLNEYFRP